MIGLGHANASLHVYIANRPPLASYQQLDSLQPMQAGEIKAIADATGNHWRKVFNVFAKLVYGIESGGESSWQAYRDHRLLQAGSNELLLFDTPDLEREGVHIITGKTHAEALGLRAGLVEVESGFYLDAQRQLIVCPYFDYRQLSNVKIQILQELVQGL